MKREFKNILLVRTDRVGDVVLTTPSIKALKEAYPQAKISMMVAPSTVDLIDNNPFLDEVLIDDRQKIHKGPFGFLKLISSLRQRKFDLAVVFHTKKRTNLLCFLAGIPHRVGYKNDKFGFLLTQPIQDDRNFGKKHEAQYCLDLLKNLEVKADDMTLDLYQKDEAENWADQWIKEQHLNQDDRLIAIHAGSSDPARRWPSYRFAELMDKLSAESSYKFVLIGTSDLASITDEIKSLTKAPFIDIVGKTKISQLASLLKRCDLFISNDSGPVHVASGVGTPVVDIFTRNQAGINPQRWGPLSPKSRVVSVPENYDISFKKSKPIDQKNLELIRTEEVLEAVDAIFKLC